MIEGQGKLQQLCYHLLWVVKEAADSSCKVRAVSVAGSGGQLLVQHSIGPGPMAHLAVRLVQVGSAWQYWLHCYLCMCLQRGTCCDLSTAACRECMYKAATAECRLGAAVYCSWPQSPGVRCRCPELTSISAAAHNNIQRLEHIVPRLSVASEGRGTRHGLLHRYKQVSTGERHGYSYILM